MHGISYDKLNGCFPHLFFAFTASLHEFLIQRQPLGVLTNPSNSLFRLSVQYLLLLALTTLVEIYENYFVHGLGIVLKKARMTKKGDSDANVAIGDLIETLVVVSEDLVQVVAKVWIILLVFRLIDQSHMMNDLQSFWSSYREFRFQQMVFLATTPAIV